MCAGLLALAAAVGVLGLLMMGMPAADHGRQDEEHVGFSLAQADAEAEEVDDEKQLESDGWEAQVLLASGPS